MIKSLRLFLSSILLLFSCTQKISEESIQKWKNEITETEQEFSDMAAEQGIQSAFLTFASDSAVLNRNNNLVKGKTALEEYYSNSFYKDNDVNLTWKPDFVDVALSGDMGYTYGHYTFSYSDSLGNRIVSRGIFHTVWKKQPDGTWKFVWD